MKLLGDAASRMGVIEFERAKIDRIERYLGSLKIRGGMDPDLPGSGGAPRFYWMAEPEDRSLVLVFATYNWGPGAGPRLHLSEVLDSLLHALNFCEGVATGFPGPHHRVPKPASIRAVEPAPAPAASVETVNRQLAAVSADLELIGRAFMEGQPPGSCYTPAQIADWVRARRREETRQA